MLPQRPSHRRPAVRTIGVLILSLSAAQSIHAQAPSTPGIPENLREEGPIVPESTIPRAPMTSPSGGLSRTQPVWTPGYFDVVCPAMCYGGAFHVCGVRAFGGPGYYGPFRRYWAYGTYGPNFNIGPDNSIQYGLVSGVIYVAERRGHGLKHGGGDGCPVAAADGMPGVPASGGGAGSSRGAGERGKETSDGPSLKEPEKLAPPTGNSAHLRIRVPKNAEVLVEGSKTAATGTVREFVSPPLVPGKNMIYSILVRYTDAGGKKIEERHSIRVHANDRLDLDCTQPANAEPTRATVLRP